MRNKVFRIIRASIPEPGRRNLVEAYINSLERAMEKANEKAITDSLTGIDNRRAFEIALKRMISRSLKIQAKSSAESKPQSILSCITKGWEYPVSCVMTDIDHFKEVNDTYGHQTGDMALRFFADYLKSQLTEMEAVGRFGGEEFILAFEGAPQKNAFLKVNEMRKEIQEMVVTNNLKLKFSAGICSSEHSPEIVLLFNKTILSVLKDYMKRKSVSKQMADIAKRLKTGNEKVETWFYNIKESGKEYISKAKISSLQEMLNHKRTDFCGYLMEQRADIALYRAKKTGRNKVCIWTPDGIIDQVE